jgi:hypothetical protein
MNYLKFLFHFIFLMVLASCNPSSIDVAFLGGINLSLTNSTVSVDSTTVYSGLSTTVKVTTKDQYGNILKFATNVDIKFSIKGGTSVGSFSNIIDNHDGTFSVDFTGENAGTAVQIYTTVNGKLLESAPSITVLSGNYSLANSYVTLSSNSVQSASTVTAILHVYDLQNNPATTGGLSVAFSSLGGGSTVSFGNVVDNDDGTYSATVTGVAAGTATSIVAKISGNSLISTLPTLSVVAGSASALSINSGNNQIAAVGTSLSSALVVKVVDSNANAVSGVVIDWTTSGGSLGSSNCTSLTSGLCSNSLTLGAVSGVYTVTATLHGTSTATIFTITANPGGLSNFLLSSVPSTATAGTSFNFSVTARDAYNNIIPTYVGTVRFSSSDGNSPSLPSNYTFIASDNGVHSFSFTLKTAGNKTITVQDASNGTPSATTSNILVSAGAASQLVFITEPSNQTAGSSISTMLVRALDAQGNTASAFVGNVNIAIGTNAGGGALSGTTTIAASAGSISIPGLSIDKAGTGYTLVATSSGLTSITSQTFNVTAGAAASVAVLSGNGQSGAAGSSLGASLIAVVKDTFNNLVPSATVDWSTGSGTLSITSSSTNASGQSSTQLTLGPTAGTNTVTATVHGTAFSTNFTSTITAGNTIGSIAWDTSPGTTYTASNSSAMTAFSVKLLDSFGNLMSTNSATVTLSLTSGTGTLLGTLTKTASSGVVTFNDIKYTKAENIIIKATENTSGHSYNVSSSSITINPAVPALSQSSIASNASQVQSDGTSGANITVTLKDVYGNAVPNQSVQISATGSGNTLTQPGSATDANGQAVGTIKSTASGTKAISILTPSGFSSLSTSVTFIATTCSPVNSTIVATSPVIANGVATSTVTLTILDDYSNPVASITPGISATGSGNTYGNCSASDANGVSTCTMSSTVAETKTISISSPFTKAGGSIVFNPGAASQLAFTTNPGGGVAGSSWPTQGVVKILDAQGNVVTSGVDSTATVSLTLYSGTGALLGTTSMSAVAGVANFSGKGLTINLAGSKIIRATKADTSGSGGTSSFVVHSAAVTVTPASATSLTIAGISSSVTAGSSSAFTVTAQDVYGNTATGYTGTVALTSSDTLAALSSNSTLTNGVGNFSAILKTSGTQSVTATDTVTSSITGSKTGITVGATSADHLAIIAGNSQSTTVGTTLGVNPKVRVYDIYGNAVAGFSLSFTPNSGSVGSSTVTSDSQGYASTTMTLGLTAGSSSLLVAGVTALPGTPASVTFSETGIAGAASVIALSSGNSQSVAAGSALPQNLVVVVKDANSNVVQNATIDWTTTSGSLTSSSSLSGSDGLASNTLNPGTVAGVKTVTATIHGTSTSITFSETVTPAGISSTTSSIAALPLYLSAGSTATVTMTIKDQYGNAIPNQSANFISTGSNNTIVQLVSLTDANGQVTGTLTSSKAETKTISFSLPVALSGVSSTLTFTPDTASTLAVSGVASSVVAGASNSVTVTAKDSYANVVTSYTGTIRFTSVDTQASLPSNYTFVSGDSGAHTFSGVIFKTVGNQSITATDTVTSSVTGLQNGIAVTAALSMAFTTPTASSYINLSNVTSYSASGTCTVNSQTINFTLVDSAANQVTKSTTCSSLAWSFSSLDTSSLVDGVINITARDAYGNSLASVVFNKDVVRPAITNGSFTIANGSSTVTSPNLSIQMIASDSLSGLSQIGFATMSTDCTSALASASWQTYSSGNNYNFLTSYSSGSKTICSWAKDVAGNVSLLTNVQGQDYQTVTINLGAPPAFSTLSVSNGNASSVNYGTNSLVSGDSLKISFSLTSTNNLATNPVSIYYTTSSSASSWTALSAASAVGSPGSGQTSWTYTYTGANAPTGGFFLLKLVAADIYGNSAAIISPALNTGNWSQFAGNISTGLGVTATSARIQSYSTDYSTEQVAVDSSGKMFFTTANMGIVSMSPSDGVLNSYLTTNAGTTETGVPGTITTSTNIPTIYNMVIDGYNLYMSSTNGKIYLVNTSTNAISVFAGGGSGGCGNGSNGGTSCSGFSPSSLYKWSYGKMTIDPVSKSLYFVNSCDPTNTASSDTTASVKIQKITQSNGVATAVSDVAGNCALATSPASGNALAVSLYNTSNTYKSTHSDLVYIPTTGVLYFSGYNGNIVKIMNGNLYVSSAMTMMIGAVYISSQNKVFLTQAGAIKYFTPTSTAGFDEALTSYIQSEANCVLTTCRADGVSLTSAGVTTNSLFAIGGQLGFADNAINSKSYVRYRIVSPGTSPTLQTIAGTDRFSGAGGDPNLAYFGYLTRLIYKSTSDSTNFSPGLYIQDSGSGRILSVQSGASTISVSAGSGINKVSASGATFDTTVSPDYIFSSPNGFNNLTFDTLGNFTYSGRSGKIINTNGGVINYLLTGISGEIFAQADGYSGTTALWYDGQGLDGIVYDTSGNMYIGGYNGVTNANNKIMVRNGSNGKWYKVIGGTTSATSADCSTSGCANSLSITSLGNSDGYRSNYFGPIDINYSSGAGRLLFSEGTKIRYVTSPASIISGTSTSKYGTLVDFSTVTPGAFTYTYTDSTNTQINEIFYVSSTGKLYCYRVASGIDSNCSSTAPGTNLGPSFSTLSSNTIATDSSNNIFVVGTDRNVIYKYAIPIVSNVAGTTLEDFDSVTSGWSNDNTGNGAFVSNAVGTDGAGNNTGLAGQLSYSFSSGDFAYGSSRYYYNGTACAGYPSRPCISLLKVAPSGLQARTISIWVKSTSQLDLKFRVLSSDAYYYDYTLNSLNRNYLTGSGTCSGCSNGWFNYIVDLSYPSYQGTAGGVGTVTKPYTPPQFTLLGGNSTIASFGVVATLPGSRSWPTTISGTLAIDLIKIKDAATTSLASSAPLSRSTTDVNILTSSATVQSRYKTDYISNFGICSHMGELPGQTGYTWPSPYIDSSWTYPKLFQNANINILRTDLAWASVEPTTAGTYTFPFDTKIANLLNANIKLLGILNYNNLLYATNAKYGVQGNSNMTGWKNYVNATVARETSLYGSNVKWEIWNEPDLSVWLGATADGISNMDDGSLYSTLVGNTLSQLTTTATNNSFAVPYAMAGSIAGMHFQYLDKSFQAGTADTANAISFHTYPNSLMPEYLIPELTTFASQITNYYNGKSITVPDIWVTETGVASTAFDSNGNYVGCTPTSGACNATSNGLSAGGREFQAIHTIRLLLHHFTMGMYDIIYEMTDNGVAYGASSVCLDNTSGQCNSDPQIYQYNEDNFGLIEAPYYGNNSLGTGTLVGKNFGLTPKPAYYAVKTYTSFLNAILGSSNSSNAPTFDGAINLGIAQAHALRFHDNNHKYLVMWGEQVDAKYKIYLPSTPTIKKTCASSPNGIYDDCSGNSANYVTPIGADGNGTYITIDRHPVYLTF